MKKFSALIAAVAITAGIMPSVYADNSDYIGFFKATDADGISFAELNILTCDEDSFTISFKRLKNEVEKITYKFDEGTINESDGSGTAKFEATLTASGAKIPGTAILSFINDELVKITCTSYQNELFYEGIMRRSTSSPSSQPNNNPQNNTEKSDDVHININGKKLSFSNDVKPRIIDDSTYVPLRSVLSNLGINVYWDEYARTQILNEQLITCTKNSTILQFARTLNNTGENKWTLKKWENTNTDTPGTNIDIIYRQPVLIGNSSYIPLRIVSESFGATVSWDEVTRTVFISTDATNEFLYDSNTIGAMEDFTLSAAQAYITDDFTDVVPHPTPYFSPQGKFYLFDAKDQWNNVSLRIFTGGYIDVLPHITEVPATDTSESNSEPPATDTTVENPETQPTDSTTDETVSEDVVVNDATEETQTVDTASEEIITETAPSAPAETTIESDEVVPEPTEDSTEEK